MSKLDVLKWLVGALLLFGLLYPSATRFALLGMPIENFNAGVSVTNPELRQSGANLYLSDPTMFCALQQNLDATLADHKEILLFRACIGIKDPNRDFEVMMDNYIKTLDYQINKQTLRTNNFEDVTNRITQVLNTIRASNGNEHKLKGPLYALVFQSPYYRDNRTGTNAGSDSVIHVQPFNIQEYGYRPSVILRDIIEGQAIGSQEPEEGIAFTVYIMSPMYDPANKLRIMSPESTQNAVERCVGYWLRQSTSDNMCKMKCPNHSVYTCGCLNKKNDSPYEAVCLGPKNAKDKQKKDYINYGSLYRIHERHPTMVNIFDSRSSFKDDCAAKI